MLFGEMLRMARDRAGLTRAGLALRMPGVAVTELQIEQVELGRLAPSSIFALAAYNALEPWVVCGRPHWISIASLTADLKRDGVGMLRADDRRMLERIQQVFLQPDSTRAEVLRSQLRAIEEVGGLLG